MRNHLAIRDALRSDAGLAARYGSLKRSLASRFSNDSDQYGAGKTDFLVSILERCNFSDAEIDSIRAINQPAKMNPGEPDAT